jgi:hypothetical protein
MLRGAGWSVAIFVIADLSGCQRRSDLEQKDFDQWSPAAPSGK